MACWQSCVAGEKSPRGSAYTLEGSSRISEMRERIVEKSERAFSFEIDVKSEERQSGAAAATAAVAGWRTPTKTAKIGNLKMDCGWDAD